MRVTSVIGVILLLALLYNPVQALSAIPPATNSVSLAWDPSPGPEVTGYRVYYGAASRNYSTSIVVGNLTTVTVSGLSAGVTYFFAVAAYDALGLESPFSNEISYTVPGGPPTVQIRVTSSRQTILTVTGLAGRSYDILATQNLNAWTVIGTVTLGAGASLDFTDTNAASHPVRYYRTLEKP